MITAMIGVGHIGSSVARRLGGGDLRQLGSNCELLDLNQARAAVDSKEVAR